MTSVEIIADSKNKQGDRPITYLLTFPRFLLAEFNTHRMFSRNSASSRAIPFKTMVDQARNNPFIPIAFQKSHKGMQGTEYLEGYDKNMAINTWLGARNSAIDHAEYLDQIGVTKQLCNRLLEPFLYHTTIVTSTEWDNFFKLRCPQYQQGQSPVFRSKLDLIEYYSDAPGYCQIIRDQSTMEWLKINKGQGEIHMMDLAEKMWDCRNESTPKVLEEGEWHIPFGDKMDEIKILSIVDNYNTMEEFHQRDEILKTKIKIATARCARLSYLNYEGKDDYGADIKLHDKLIKDCHWSPPEHCGKAMTNLEYQNHIRGIASHNDAENGNPIFQMESMGWSGNFKGFIQYRKTFKGESGTV